MPRTKTSVVDERPGEFGNERLLSPDAKKAAAAEAVRRQQADAGVGAAILGYHDHHAHRRPNEL